MVLTLEADCILYNICVYIHIRLKNYKILLTVINAVVGYTYSSVSLRVE